MPTAKILWFSDARGFGFLQTTNSEKLFFHVSAWRGDEDDLRKDFKLSSSRARAVTADPVQSMCGQLVPQLAIR